MRSRASTLLSSLLIACATLRAQDLREILAPLNIDPQQAVLVVGDSPEARAFGFKPTERRVTVRSVVDARQPELQIVWEHALDVRVFEMPAHVKVFARERWSGAPLVAGLASKDGTPVLWTAVRPGKRGYERFPYLPQALADLGLRPKIETRSLWVFFDSSYRMRADVNYLAARWRRGGVAALQVAAWHYWERDAARDAWLARLIEACHNHGILVYAWLELPHVSDAFWNEHPEWREKTASGQDAQLDWRKLMNLAEPECERAIAAGLDDLARRFDWDGLNLGELYFESLEGYENPARFTPFNARVRAEFRRQAGFDPQELYQSGGAHHYAKNPAAMRKFLDYRAALAVRLQDGWLKRLAALRDARPQLDLVLTHIDDRFDTTMRDRLGVDAPRLLASAERRGVTFLIEDPATVWHLGPERYAEIARRYAPLTKHPELLAIDLNVVERYQDVYPVKQQTGTELFQLMRRAAESFERVALYFENSILAPDWPLLAAAAAPVRKVEWTGESLEIDAPQPLSVAWHGWARMDGREWPVQDGERVLVPPGRHKLTVCKEAPSRRLADFNGKLLDARVERGRIRVKYESRSRAIALIDDGHGAYKAHMLLPGAREIDLPE